jgi:hypothetical protein
LYRLSFDLWFMITPLVLTNFFANKALLLSPLSTTHELWFIWRNAQSVPIGMPTDWLFMMSISKYSSIMKRQYHTYSNVPTLIYAFMIYKGWNVVITPSDVKTCTYLISLKMTTHYHKNEWKHEHYLSFHSFFVWLYCLSFDFQLLITPLMPSKSFLVHIYITAIMQWRITYNRPNN